MESRFKIVGKLDSFVPTGETTHAKERKQRFSVYGNLIGKKPLFIFEVDNSHEKGNEIHAIHENGVVYVYNKSTGWLVTCMAPRYEQMRMYFVDFWDEQESVARIFRACNRNHRLGLNEVQGGAFEKLNYKGATL
jgi:hypothetical protein